MKYVSRLFLRGLLFGLPVGLAADRGAVMAFIVSGGASLAAGDSR